MVSREEAGHHHPPPAGEHGCGGGLLGQLSLGKSQCMCDGIRIESWELLSIPRSPHRMRLCSWRYQPQLSIIATRFSFLPS